MDANRDLVKAGAPGVPFVPTPSNWPEGNWKVRSPFPGRDVGSRDHRLRRWTETQDTPGSTVQMARDRSANGPRQHGCALHVVRSTIGCTDGHNSVDPTPASRRRLRE